MKDWSLRGETGGRALAAGLSAGVFRGNDGLRRAAAAVVELQGDFRRLRFTTTSDIPKQRLPPPPERPGRGPADLPTNYANSGRRGDEDGLHKVSAQLNSTGEHATRDRPPTKRWPPAHRPRL